MSDDMSDDFIDFSAAGSAGFAGADDSAAPLGTQSDTSSHAPRRATSQPMAEQSYAQFSQPARMAEQNYARNQYDTGQYAPYDAPSAPPRAPRHATPQASSRTPSSQDGYAQDSQPYPQQPAPTTQPAPVRQQTPTEPVSQGEHGTNPEAFISSVFRGNPARQPVAPPVRSAPPQAAQSAPQQPAPQSTSAIGSMFVVPERDANWSYNLVNPAANDVFGGLAQTDPRAQREAEREQRIEERREQGRKTRDESRGGHRAVKERRRDRESDADTPSGCAVRAKGLGKTIDGHTVWSGVTFKLEPGDMVALTGPSGCGKTTLLNCIGLLDSPTEGRLTLDGTDVTHLKGGVARRLRRDKIGYLFLDYALVENDTVKANIMIALDSVPRGRRQQAVAEALESVGLSGRENAIARTLTGGEQQRVALARLIAKKPRLVIADEPTGALDKGNEMTVILALRQMADHGTTIVVATHSDAVAGMCDRVIDLSKPMA